MSDLKRRAVQLYDAFTHRHYDRRRLIRDMTALAGSAVAAEALIATLAASPAAAQQIAGDDDRLTITRDSRDAAGTAYTVYSALPRGVTHRLPVVMVIHENRGLTAHIEDITRRLGVAGFHAFAPDFLSPAGGTPTDEDKARTMIGALDLERAVADAVALADAAADASDANGRAGVVGFCWGGAMVNRIAVAGGRKINAAVAYYGPAPDPAEAVRVKTPMLLHYAGEDARVNATGGPWTEALLAAGDEVEAYTYPGVDHAFNNDTSSARYNAEAAGLAWGRTLDFFHKLLDRHL